MSGGMPSVLERGSNSTAVNQSPVSMIRNNLTVNGPPRNNTTPNNATPINQFNLTPIKPDQVSNFPGASSRNNLMNIQRQRAGDDISMTSVDGQSNQRSGSDSSGVPNPKGDRQNESYIPKSREFSSDSRLNRNTEPIKRSSRHLMYAVEILIFAIVGWGWLAIREFMGEPPVMDILIFICLLISAAVNMALALVYYTTDQFRPAAKGFFSHTLSLWALYLYSLIESTTEAWSPLCCGGDAIYSVSKTYTAAYFGGLQFHQTAGAVTLAFISVFLILAAGQMKVCLQDTRLWILREAATSLVCLVSLHLALFAIRSKSCIGESVSQFVILVGILALIMMSNILPVAVSRLLYLANESKKLIQAILELALTLLLVALSLVLSFSLGGRPSSILMFFLGGVFVWQLGFIIYYIWMIKKRNRGSSTQPQRLMSNFKDHVEKDYYESIYDPSSAPAQRSLNAGFRGLQARPVMFLPDIREMRSHEARRRGSSEKVW